MRSHRGVRFVLVGYLGNVQEAPSTDRATGQLLVGGTWRERMRVARRLGPRSAVRAAVRLGHSTRRQLALVTDVTGRLPVPIPASGVLEPTDPESFTGFADLVEHVAPPELLELLWYVRFAAEGARTLLVARDPQGRPTFSTWMIDADEQSALGARFTDGFHRLESKEMLLEGVFTFPDMRGRGIANAGIAAACAWASQHGAATVWAYPYLDNFAVLPRFVPSDFEPHHARVETISMRRVRGTAVPLSSSDVADWERAHAVASARAGFSHAPPPDL
jgi:GNAT superfamily N-acetyltransferase